MGFVFGFVSCNNDEVSNTKNIKVDKHQSIDVLSSDTTVIKQTLINAFNELDSMVIKQSNPLNLRHRNAEIFNQYITSYNLKNSYYDEIIAGYTVKYFCCENLRFPFCIIRNTQNLFFYFSISDYYRYDSIFKYKFYDGVAPKERFILKDFDTLMLYEDTASAEMKYFQKIIDSENSDSLNSKEKRWETATNYLNLLELMYKKMYYVYRKNLKKNSSYRDLFNDEKRIKEDNIENINQQRLEINRNSLGDKYITIENVGEIYLVLYMENEKLKIKKYFTPQILKSFTEGW